MIISGTPGSVECRYYRLPGARFGAIWAGGVGGGWDSPARDLYPRLSEDLLSGGIASLRVRYRDPRDLRSAVDDVRMGIEFFASEGIGSVALTGHSFGGAVVISAAAAAPSVRAVVTLASQSFGADAVRFLRSRCALLLIHGLGDTVLPPLCSDHIYRSAGEPKKLVTFPGATHGLDEAADEVTREVKHWILRYLPGSVQEG